MTKRILFLTGTRADFGKLKSLIQITSNENFDVHIFATGMHLQKKYGETIEEIEKCGFENIHRYENHTSESTMDLTLAKTITGLSQYIKVDRPDMIVVHGDRVETLAGAIVGSLNNILVAHIEGGEVSGTIDELIRHAVTKMSHVHLVANENARTRLLQMGESAEDIYVIGSPDVDIMLSHDLPSLEETLNHYDINFKEYAILMFHPVTTEIESIEEQANNLVDAAIESKKNFVVIYPNNDLGSEKILQAYKKFEGIERINIYPSIRFEFFLVLLKNAAFILGNSSAGIREAPYYNVPTINTGSRQNNRALSSSIIQVENNRSEDIKQAIEYTAELDHAATNLSFGEGNSDVQFLGILKSERIWQRSKQKVFNDLQN
tara:strand:+ start:53 stop:1183 length:1131 start_codon:yes stop_codon:yes gene_type:complete